MKKIFENIVKKHSEDNVFLDQLFTSVYLYSRGIYDVKNEFIKDHLLEKDHELVLSVLPQIGSELSTQSLIELFEIAIPRDEQQTNGAVYTPDVIKDYIVDSTLTKFIDKLDTVLVADISCGCGAFLYSSAKKLKHKTEQPYRDIFSQLYGLDISSNSLQRAKILLSLLAIVEGEDEEGFSFNLFEGNALNFDWHKISSVKNNKGFDIVVGNPPYVRAKHIDSASKKLLKNWKVASSGNPDLYLPFFEIGMRWLNSNGVLGYITVNSFFKSVNARGLRNYLSNNEFPLTIINFGHEQIFEKRLTYTCICFIDKQNDGNVSYTKATSKDLLNKKVLTIQFLITIT
ncbi:N-6 DNA methylase [Tenacibaculum maritimum]